MLLQGPISNLSTSEAEDNARTALLYKRFRHQSQGRKRARQALPQVLANEVIAGFDVAFWYLADVEGPLLHVCFLGVHSTGQCNTSRSLSAGVSKPKVFRGR